MAQDGWVRLLLRYPPFTRRSFKQRACPESGHRDEPGYMYSRDYHREQAAAFWTWMCEERTPINLDEAQAAFGGPH
jgi:hypothetical protein